MSSIKKVSIGMSGGVDSAVSALLIKEMGFLPRGVTMKLYRPENKGEDGKECGSDRDIEDAKAICSALGIGHTVYDFGKEFSESVINNFTQTYLDGGTPNPCIVCNREMKFGKMLERSICDGYEYIATGHYAVVEQDLNGRFLLRRAEDLKKDQSYVLWTLNQYQLSHTVFPLGKYTKVQVRQIAEENGFVNAHKSDSQDICFVPDGDYAGFIERHLNFKFPDGNYLDINGNVIGRHKGIIHYTIGQRKGLGISMGHHVFVKEKDAQNNTVTLSLEEDLFSRRVKINNINLIPFDSIDNPIRVMAKIRYRHEAAPATIHMIDKNSILIEFDEPQRAPAKGQSAVIYDSDNRYIIGGGIIV